MVELVPLPKSHISEQLSEWFESMAVRARDGEFTAALVVLMTPSGQWLMRNVGEKDPLRLVGMLESAKTDVLACTATGEKSGL